MNLTIFTVYNCKESQTQKLAKKEPQDCVVGGEKQQLPRNVKNGFWDVLVPISVKVNWLQTKNWTKSPLNFRLKNWQKSCPKWIGWDQKLNKIISKSQTQKLAKKKPQDFVVSGEKQQLPINVKNGFWNISVPISVKVNWLWTKTEQNHLWISDSKIGQKAVKNELVGIKNWTKSPQNLKLRNWPKRSPGILLVVVKNSGYL